MGGQHPDQGESGEPGVEVLAVVVAGVRPALFMVSIRVPTLLHWGDDDRRSPMSVATQLLGAIPNAELAVISNAGHISNMEQPEQFNAHVRRFCLSNAGR